MTIGNPYVVDRPLAEGDLFVGRHEVLAEVTQEVRRGGQAVLVYGPARMGKTSFLRQLMNELSPQFLAVSIERAWPRSGSPEQAFQELRSRIADELSTLLGQPIPDLSAALDALPGRRVVILVDGLSVTDLAGEAGAEFITQWQGWLTSMSAVHFVVAVDGKPEGAALLNPALASLPSVELEGLGLEETEELLIRPAKGRLTYEFAAIRRIWELTAGHPYLVQLFGYVLFAVRSGAVRVGLPDVERVAQDVVAAADRVMERVWRSCSPQTQVILALANELPGRHGIVTLLDLCNAARAHRLELSVPAIQSGLAELLAAGILRRLSEDSYSFCTDVHRLWLVRQKPLAKILEDRGIRKRLVSPTPRIWRPSGWSSVGLWLIGLAMLSFVIVLWNMRGSAGQLATGSSPTATTTPFATRATLVIGPALGRIAYMAKDDPDATWDIWIMRGDGSDPQRLTDDASDDMSPTWSPDGKSIAFVSERDGNREIYTMKADGTEQINLTHNPSEDWAPAWSPDGSRIAFSSYRDANWEVYVMGSDGSEPLRLTDNSAADYGACWSPDGQEIAFHSNRDGNWEVYAVGSDGQGLRRLTIDDATDFAPAWSSDGTTIAFESYRDGNMEIYLMDADGQGQRNVSNDPYSNEHGPAWARDGTTLLYFSNRDGGWDVFSMKPDGTEKSNLTLSSDLEHGPEWHE